MTRPFTSRRLRSDTAGSRVRRHLLAGTCVKGVDANSDDNTACAAATSSAACTAATATEAAVDSPTTDGDTCVWDSHVGEVSDGEILKVPEM